MICSKRLLSAVLSCVLATAVFPTASLVTANAGQISEDSVSDIYDSTNNAESKASISTADAISADEQDMASEEPFNVFDIYNAHQEFVSVKETPPPPPSLYVKKEGIDVSYAQGKIDWKAVKESGVDYAIIRAGYGYAKKYPNQIDTTFKYNIENAQAVGMDVGVYWYSYATPSNKDVIAECENDPEYKKLTTDDQRTRYRAKKAAQNEAESCYEAIKNYKLQYPVYFDIEDESQMGLPTHIISIMVESFCSTLKAKGYYVGLYSYSNLLMTKIYDNVREKYDVWVASVGITESKLKQQYTGSYGMWQYSWTGKVKGISTDVDMDHCYMNYPYIVSPDTYVNSSLPLPSSMPVTQTTVKPANTGVAKGVDVSEWQGEIDWAKVKASGVDFAIIRAGYGMYENQKDKYFEQNIKAAKAAGIDCGVYWYSYATNTSEAKKEAELFYNIIKSYKFEYPAYVEMGCPGISGMNAEQISNIADAFCSYMESKGYYIAIKSYASFLSNKLQSSIFKKYDVWVANHDVEKPQYSGSYSLWQYSGSGQVNGISTAVNLNYAYYSFPSIMKNNHLNGY
ncbi:MAG TPA: glycoside hydrolase family 25 protein [Ruminococcus sp.]|nr:glycoside hydrolase family 25 protein [Ruminococcus sp.]